MDLISALPDKLIESLLMKMSLRDAARTCILSRRWRHSWVKLPHLKLDASFWYHLWQYKIQYRADKFAIILFRILLLHQGPITNFSLYIPILKSPPEIDTLITYIVKKGVQTCFLDMFPRGYYKLHSSLLTCPTLIDLELSACEVNFLPPTFEGFISNLTRISFVDVIISAEALQCLVSSCPSLQILQLKISLDLSCLQINAPKLVQLLYYYTNNSWNSLEMNFFQQQQSILELLGGFPDLKYLNIDGHCVKSLVAGWIPTTTRMPIGMLHCLKFIKLVDICLEDVDEYSSVLCLIRSSPNLQKLEVDRIRSSENSNNMENLLEEEVEDYDDLTLVKLVEVEMLSIVGGRLELKIIRFLLAKSPSLKKMTIGLATSMIADKGLHIIREMFIFQRAASNVEVHIKDD